VTVDADTAPPHDSAKAARFGNFDKPTATGWMRGGVRDRRRFGLAHGARAPRVQDANDVTE